MPEVLYAQIMSRMQMTDNVTAVLLRRVFTRRMNIGWGLRPGSAMVSNSS